MTPHLKILDLACSYSSDCFLFIFTLLHIDLVQKRKAEIISFEDLEISPIMRILI